MDKLIYLASPYSHADQSVTDRRVRQVQDATARLIEDGKLVFSPIVHSHPIHEQVSFEAHNPDTGELLGWMAYDLAMVDKADELWILELEGWHTSRGVEAEFLHAIHTGKTVRFLSYPELADRGNIQGFADEKIFTDEKATVYEAKAPAFQVGDKVKVLANTTYHAFEIGQIVEVREVWVTTIECTGDYKGRGITQTLYEADIEPYTEAPKQRIIGLNGVARAGKDTVGNYLVEKHGFVRIGLADAVREAAMALNPVITIDAVKKGHGAVATEWEIDGVNSLSEIATSKYGNHKFYPLRALVNQIGWDEAKKIKEVRQLLQRLGTEVGRNFFGEDCWINIARKKIEAAYPNPVVITDIRFPNEAEFVKELGGTVALITRKDHTSLNGHSSEQSLDEGLIDCYLLNGSDEYTEFDGSLESLYEQVDGVVADLNEQA